MECPNDTAEAAFGSPKIKEFLTKALDGADVLICQLDPADLENNEDFSDTRFAGLLGQHDTKQIIFVVLCSPEKAPEKLRNLQHQTSQYKKTPVYIAATTQSEVFEEVRKSLQGEVEKLIETESEKLGKVCVRFGTQIELLLNIDKQRQERNAVA